MISPETYEIVPEITMVTRKIVTTQQIILLRSFFAAAGSDLDTDLSPFYLSGIFNDGGRQDKSYGLGRVVFHRTKPVVAAQAVPV